jgi:hypothetical protein
MKFSKLLAGAVLVVGSAQVASAQLATQTQVVNVTVSAVDNFTVAGGPVSLTVGVGTTSDAVTATYSIQTNSATARVIKAQITAGTAFPPGVTVTANFTAPTTGTSAGPVALTTTNTDVVTAITNTDDTGKVITYSVTATAAATPGTLGGRTITYTLQ